MIHGLMAECLNSVLPRLTTTRINGLDRAGCRSFNSVLSSIPLVSPDPMPEESSFIRGDQYSFVKKGVPSLAISEGFKTVDPTLDGKKITIERATTHYRTPQDDSRCRHLYSRVRQIWSSRARRTILSQAFIRSTARHRNFWGYSSRHFLCILQLLSDVSQLTSYANSVYL